MFSRMQYVLKSSFFDTDEILLEMLHCAFTSEHNLIQFFTDSVKSYVGF